MCEFSRFSPSILLSQIFLHVVHGQAIAASDTAYSGYHEMDVTVLSSRTIALYAVVIVLALLLCFCKELLLFFLAGSNQHLADMYQMNEYNQISKHLRRQMECEADAPYSNKFADLCQVAGKESATAEIVEVDLESAS